VIVDPAPPKVYTHRMDFKPGGSATGIGSDELTPWKGVIALGFKEFPKTGEFRIRTKASTILPAGVSQMPLRLIMGYNINENQSTFQVEPVGTAVLRNNPDHPEVFEFHGRIENYPPRAMPDKKTGEVSSVFTVTAQNLYNDGTLNDDNRYFYWPRRASAPRAVVNYIEFEAPVFDVWPPAYHAQILFDSPLRESDTEEYVRQVIDRFLPRAYRRPVTKEEVDLYVKIYRLVAPEMETFEAAMRETLSMVLVSPKFLFHAVPGVEPEYQQYALASQLSYFLWGSSPDQKLLDLVVAGKLDDQEVIAQQVHRLLADDKSKDFIKYFTIQWLSLNKMKTVPINKDLFPRFLFYVPAGERAGSEEPYRPTIRDYMIDETVGYVGEVLKRNSSVMELVDSDFAYLNQPLAAHYGVEGVEGLELRPVPIKPEHKLGGLLTQGSVLIGNGTGSAPHPIYRAVWLREAILGDEVAPPPADVPALSDTAGESVDHALTIKDLLAQHRKQESCNDCHSRLDPWGIPFEEYNAVGKYQPALPKSGIKIRAFQANVDKDLNGYKAYLNEIFTEKVEATSRVPHGPTVNGMDDLKAYLIKDREKDIAKNVLTRLLKYGMGRKLTFQDRYAVEALMAESKKQGYKMQDMVVAVCQSKLFRNEK
jgi:hypothetical protein